MSSSQTKFHTSEQAFQHFPLLTWTGPFCDRLRVSRWSTVFSHKQMMWILHSKAWFRLILSSNYVLCIFCWSDDFNKYGQRDLMETRRLYNVAKESSTATLDRVVLVVLWNSLTFWWHFLICPMIRIIWYFNHRTKFRNMNIFLSYTDFTRNDKRDRTVLNT